MPRDTWQALYDAQRFAAPGGGQLPPIKVVGRGLRGTDCAYSTSSQACLMGTPCPRKGALFHRREMCGP